MPARVEQHQQRVALAAGEARSGRCPAAGARPGAGAVQDRVGHRRRDTPRPARRAGPADPRRRLLPARSTACSTAAANARIAAARPGCRSGRRAPGRRRAARAPDRAPASSSAPTPTGPPILCPVTVSASPRWRRSSPAAARRPGRRRCGTGCRTPPRRAASSATGWTVPTSLLAHITLITATLAGSRSIGRRRNASGLETGRSGRPAASSTSALLVLGQPAHASSTAWCSIAVASTRRPAGSASRRAQNRPLTREVVGLGAAGGEDHLAGPRAERLRRSSRGTPRPPAGPGARRCAATRGCRLSEFGPSSPRAPPGASAWSRRGRGRPASPAASRQRPWHAGIATRIRGLTMVLPA